MIDAPSKLVLLCVGGGRSLRYGKDKLTEILADRTIFEHSVAALNRAFPSLPVIAVCPNTSLETWRQRLSVCAPRLQVVAGGDRRQDSVTRGVEAAKLLEAELVLIHDAARPLLHPTDAQRVVAGLGDNAGAILCQAVTDTVKEVDEHGAITRTFDRRSLRLSLTPQVFRVEALEDAWRRCPAEQEYTDEAALLEAAGLAVVTVEAQFPNPKITTVDDLEVVTALLARRHDANRTGV